MLTHPKISLALLILFAAAVLTLSGCIKEVEQPAVITASVVTDSVASDDGVMIYYDVRGEGGRTLVFVHCWSCDRSYWNELAENLKSDFRVVTIDLGGHGQSGMGRDDWTIEAFGADVAAVVKKLDLRDIILIGHSMGGPVCIEAARRLPERVVAIVGVDNFQSLASELTQEQVDGFMANFMPDFEGATRQFVRAMFQENADTALVNRLTADMSSEPSEVGLSAIGHTLTYNYREALADMRRPIRAISSDRYPTDVAGNRQIAESFEVRLMPGHGHFLFLEDPVTFNRLLRQTISEFWPEVEVPAENKGE